MRKDLEEYVGFEYDGVRHHPRSYMRKRAIQFHPFNPLKMLNGLSEGFDVKEARGIAPGTAVVAGNKDCSGCGQ